MKWATTKPFPLNGNSHVSEPFAATANTQSGNKTSGNYRCVYIILTSGKTYPSQTHKAIGKA